MPSLKLGLVLSFLTTTSLSLDLVNITILHTNDIHSRFDEVSKYGSRCSNPVKCMGGVARIKYQADLIKNANPNTLFLNAGDLFQGTVWYSMFKWRIVANLTSTMGYDASAFGNHEFDDGIDDLENFADAVPYPLLATNLDVSLEPTLASRFRKSMIINKNGVNIALVGYVTPETKEIASTGNVEFLDEIESVKIEVARLRRETPGGIGLVILLGHSGFEKDKEIASKVRGVDLIIGGHTNTFLWNGANPRNEKDKPAGGYPFVVENQVTKKPVLVVQTNGYGRYLGKLDIIFDKDTNSIHDYSRTNPIVLNSQIGEDAQLKASVVSYRNQVNLKMNKVVGEASELIDGGRPGCRIRECGMGNLVTDAMNEALGTDIAVMNSGGIKGSFTAGSITRGDILTVLPWSNTIDKITVNGATLYKMFEHSLSGYDLSNNDPSGRFLQVSGLKVLINPSNEPGNRITKIYKTRGEEEDQELDRNASYEIAIGFFMVNGGDGYKMIPKELLSHTNIGLLDNELLLKHIRNNSPLSEPAGNRLIFLNRN